jgi:DNA-binding response OmpR family regulator
MAGGLQGKRFLLVEDNADIQAFVSTVARLEGADIVTASKGEVGLSMLSGQAPLDFVLLDLNLLGIQGWDVLREIGDATDARPPVVVFSAYTDAPTQKRAKDMGAVGFIAKPVGARELVSKLEAFLSQL